MASIIQVPHRSSFRVIFTTLLLSLLGLSTVDSTQPDWSSACSLNPQTLQSLAASNSGSNIATTMIASVAVHDSTFCGTFIQYGPSTSSPYFCWGDRSLGQFGDGYLDDSSDASSGVIIVTNAKNFTKVVPGTSHTCGLTGSGQVACWGANTLGQLGTGTIGPAVISSSDAQFVNMGVAASVQRVVDITVGTDFTCALFANSSIKCWGDNSRAQCGFDSNGMPVVSDPSTVPFLTISSPPSATVRQIVAGAKHVCVVVNQNGAVRCWGDNANGQLGLIYSTMPPPSVGLTYNFSASSYVQTGVANTNKIIQAAAGTSYTCGLFQQGQIKCWGLNMEFSGSPGEWNATAVPFTNPAVAEAAISIFGGPSSLCVLFTSNRVKCFGDNSNYQLGVGQSPMTAASATLMSGTMLSTIVSASSPSPMAMNLNITSVAVGTNAVVFVLSNNQAVAFGTPVVVNTGIHTTATLTSTTLQVCEKTAAHNRVGAAGACMNLGVGAYGYSATDFLFGCGPQLVMFDQALTGCPFNSPPALMGMNTVGVNPVLALVSTNLAPNPVSCIFGGYPANSSLYCLNCTFPVAAPQIANFRDIVVLRNAYPMITSSNAFISFLHTAWTLRTLAIVSSVNPVWQNIMTFEVTSSAAPANLYEMDFITPSGSAPCTLGQYVVQYARSGFCAQCPMGSYCPNPNSAAATACPKGTFSNVTGASSVSTCQDCLAGTYSGMGATFCSPCPAGSISSTAASSSCSPCDPGSYADPGSSQCTTCPIGKYASIPGSGRCTFCSAGTYGNDTGLVMCNECPAGTYSAQTGATSINSCIPCLSGTFQPKTGAVMCETCPRGYYGPSTGATNSSQCLPCDPGTYNPTTGAFLCTWCPSGYYSANPAAVTCTPCSSGTSSAVTGAASATTCVRCEAGSYQGRQAASSCVLCPRGRYSTVTGATSNSTCSLCKAGSAAQFAGSSECTTCAVGTYSEIDGAFTCSLCPAGRYTDNVGSNSSLLCLDCGPGRYNPAPGQASGSCMTCPAGTHQPLYGSSASSDCVACAAGTYSAAGAANCTICPEGSYSDASGSTGCTLCPKGRYNPSPQATNSSACLACPSGYVTLVAGASASSDCTPGRVSCPAGQQPRFNMQTGLYDCIALVCGDGLVISQDGSSCVGCPAGTFGAGGQCQNCTSGWFCPGLLSVPLHTDIMSALSDDASSSRRRMMDASETVSGNQHSNALRSSHTADTATPDVDKSNSRVLGASGSSSPSGSNLQLCAGLVATALQATNGSYQLVSAPSASSTNNVYSTAQFFIPGVVAAIFIAPIVFLALLKSRRVQITGGPDDVVGATSTTTKAASPTARRPGCCARMERSFTDWLTRIDIYGLRHRYSPHTIVRKFNTPLGGGMTLAGAGVFLAMCSAIIVQFAFANALVTSSLLTMDLDSTRTFARVAASSAVAPPTWLWNQMQGVQLMIVAEGEAGACLVSNHNVTFSGLTAGNPAINVHTCGSLAVSIIDCANCIFGPSASTSIQMHYSCQNMILGVTATSAAGGTTLLTSELRPTLGRFVSEVTWQLTPMADLQSNAKTGQQSRGYQLISSSISNTTTAISTTLLPASSSVTLTINYQPSQLYAYTAITEKQTVIQLLASCAGFAGIIGFFGVLFGRMEGIVVAKAPSSSSSGSGGVAPSQSSDFDPVNPGMLKKQPSQPKAGPMVVATSTAPYGAVIAPVNSPTAVDGATFYNAGVPTASATVGRVTPSVDTQTGVWTMTNPLSSGAHGGAVVGTSAGGSAIHSAHNARTPAGGLPPIHGHHRAAYPAIASTRDPSPATGIAGYGSSATLLVAGNSAEYKQPPAPPGMWEGENKDDDYDSAAESKLGEAK